MLNTLLDNPLFIGTAPHQTLSQKPLGFVDVGARGGVHPLVDPLAGVTAVLGFEPDRDEYNRLRAVLERESPWAAWAIEIHALADEDRETLLHLTAAPTSHSLLPPYIPLARRYNIKVLEPMGTLPLRTTTLDNILFFQRSQEDYWGEFIKLDTQGTELDILKGAKRTLLERTVAIYTEVEFCQVYQGQNLFSEVEIFLRNYGFSFYGLANVAQRSRKQLDKHKEIGRERLIWADAIFLKDPLAGAFKPTSLSERSHHLLFTCAMLLEYYDFALELALETWAKGREAKQIESLVRSYAGFPPSQGYQDVLELTERVKANPELANVEVGHFVDRRRYRNNYSDIVLPTSSKLML